MTGQKIENTIRKITTKMSVVVLSLVTFVYVFSFSVPSHAAPGDIAYEGQWGSNGTGDGQFSGPSYIATSSQTGNVYVTDSQNHRVQVFDEDGEYVNQWGSNGTGDGQFQRPTGITVDASDNVYVMDTDNDRVQKFTSTGVYVDKWGSSGTGNGEIDQGYGLAVNDGVLYLADLSVDKISKFDVTNGSFEGTVGTVGSGDGQINAPFGLAFDEDDNLYVTDSGNYRIQVFDSDENYLRKWGSNGTGDGQFSYVTDVVVSDRVYVADYLGNRIQVFDLLGNYISQFGAVGSGDGEFNVSGSVTLNSSGSRIYVTDSLNHRIQYFSVEVYDISEDSEEGNEGALILATTEATPGSGEAELANTGIVTSIAIAVGILLLVGAIYTYVDYLKHKKPLVQMDPQQANNYTYLHHLKVVSMPLLSYRLNITVSRVLPTKSNNITKY